MKWRSDHQKSRLDLDEVEIGSRWGGDRGARVGYGVGAGAEVRRLYFMNS